MKRFKNFKIQSKLFFTSAIIMSLVIILAAFVVFTINSMEKRYSDLMRGPQTRVLHLSGAVRELSNIRRYILFMGYAAEEPDTVKAYFDRYEKSADVFRKILDDYYLNLKDDIYLSNELKESRIQDALKIRSLFNTEYTDHVNSIYRASISGDRQLADKMIAQTIPLGDEIIGNLDLLRALVQKNEEEIIEEAQYYAEHSKNAVIAFSVCISMLVLLVSAFMSRAIKAPIVDMETAMGEIAKGDLTYPIRSVYKDELGTLSNRIGDMVEKIAEMNKTVAAMDYIDDMISVADFDYNLLYINHKMADVCGIRRENYSGKKCYEYIKGLTEPCPDCMMRKFLASGEQFPSGAYECTWNERLDMWVTGKAAVIRWIDGTRVYFSMVKDDTLRKTHEEQQKRHEEEMRRALIAAEEASIAKSHFLANMSHEIRTPMNSIIGFSELAMSDRIPPKTRDYFIKIGQSSRSLLQIINDILDISKIESGKIELEDIPFCLHEVVQFCQEAVKPKALEKNIALYCYAEPSVGKQLVGDPTRLRQALLNILSNAIKFTNTGVVKLLSSIKETSEDSVKVYFEVKDSGIGMTPEQTRKVFEPFTQGDVSMTRRYGGTGLGLSITKNIIELMGGKLIAESAPGIGSKFSFELEFKTVDISDCIQIQSPVIEEHKRPFFQGEVLLCEDNAMNQQVICEHIERVGLRTTVAANGKEGVAIVQRRIENGEKPFNLILMDIHMPVMDGLEAASKLAQLGCETPVVAITANIMSNDRETYRAHGMPDCVAKPFTSQELWDCLIKYIKPVKMETASSTGRSGADEKLRQKLLADFVKDNRNTFRDISRAIGTGDIKLAHMLAHTLKGTAGLIGRIQLQEAAFDLERALAKGKADVSGECMKKLETEMNLVLEELAPLLESTEVQTASVKDYDAEKARDLLDGLEPLLRKGNPACLSLTDSLREIPGTGVLIEQMEDFDFRPALETLAGIKRELGV